MSVLDGWSYWLSKEQYIGKSRCNIEIYVYMNAVYMVSIWVYIKKIIENTCISIDTCIFSTID